jgi:hypothetical protein
VFCDFTVCVFSDRQTLPAYGFTITFSVMKFPHHIPVLLRIGVALPTTRASMTEMHPENMSSLLATHSLLLSMKVVIVLLSKERSCCCQRREVVVVVKESEL